MPKDTRKNLVIVSTILICLGIVMIYSSSSIYAWQRLSDPFYFLKRHLFYVLLGLLSSLFAMSMDYQILKKYSKPIVLFSLLMLVLVLIPGISREIAGARRWFRFLGYSFQPSEFAQLAVIIYIASFLSREDKNIKDLFSGFVPMMMVLGLFVLLILAQPDLGTAVSLSVVVFVMLFIGGIRLSHLLAVFLLSLPALYLLIFSVSYRKRRIISFLNPWMDPQGIGFQLVQSQLALGSGGIFGVGLGQGRQKLFYLPAAHTDFIFSIIGEELGLIGTLAIVFLFILFIWSAAKIAIKTTEGFGHYLSVGIIALIAFKAVVNIGVSIGSLPTKGLPLPFVSYGGTSLVFNMISLGLLLNISKSREI